jgi:protein-L-isoaspartate(D-aspartate) O-methyltransferase
LQNFEKQRERMVSVQIKARGITDENVLKAMKKVERHRFVGQQYRRQAYEDYPLPIGEGQTISQPYIVALMTQVLNLDDTKKVLEIGSGSGYQTAVLAEICHSVYTIELVDTLGKKAAKLLADMGYGNIKVKVGDGYQGWEKYSPFDAIIVTCAPTHVPQALKEQLAEGGRMIIPVGEQFAQELVLLTKQKGELMKDAVIPVRFVPMMRRDGKPY